MEKINKVIVSMFVISVILIGIVIVMLINENNNNVLEDVKTQIGEVIYDECTDEYEETRQEAVVTNTEEEKVSPNCIITLIKYYKDCKDEINEYLSVPQELVNCTKKQVQDKYKEWEIRDFSSNQIVLYREFDGECGEHYILKDKEGKVIVYKINNNGKEQEYEKTEVSTDYLPEKDKKLIKNGLKVNSKEKLNELIESFE